MAKVTGSLDLRKGKRGDVFHAKLRVNGKPRMKKIGLAWTERSKAPPGYFTKATARVALEEIKTDIRRDVEDAPAEPVSSRTNEIAKTT